MLLLQRKIFALPFGICLTGFYLPHRTLQPQRTTPNLFSDSGGLPPYRVYFSHLEHPNTVCETPFYACLSHFQHGSKQILPICRDNAYS